MSIHSFGASARDFRVDWPAEPLKSTASPELLDTLTLDDVDELIARRGLRSPAFRMARDGQLINPKSYTLASKSDTGSQAGQLADAEGIAREIGRGSTLILQGLQRFHPPAGQLARELSDDLGARVFINAYLTPNSSKGFAEHFDPYGAFILQLDGAKQWKLRPSADASQETVTLNPLDVLWIQRGWRHDGTAVPGRASVHLTIAVNPVSQEEILSEITEKISEKVSEQIRGSVLPPLPDCDPGALEDAVRAMSDLVHAALDNLDHQGLAKGLRALASSGNALPAGSVSSALGRGR
jgi:hypothetical protein